MKLAISHYAVEPPKPNSLIPLVCFCQVLGQARVQVFVEGMNLDKTYTIDEMDILVESGQVVALPNQHPKKEENGLFLDPYGNIYLAQKKEPMNATDRMIVGRLPRYLLRSAFVPDSPNSLEMRIIGKDITEKIAYLFRPLLSDTTMDRLYLETVQKLLLKEYLLLELENSTLNKSLRLTGERFNKYES